LMNDVGYSTTKQRRIFMTDRTGHSVNFMDELTFAEASKLIEELKSQRECNRPEPFEEPWEEH
jgi:hypothetical protein